MDNLGQINDRQILYLSTRQTKNWADSLPTNNWVVVPIGHDTDSKVIDDLAIKCLEKNTLYVCALGQQCELIHDTFDHYIVQRKIDKSESIDNPIDFEGASMTTWHKDFDEGFWFATETAYPTINDEYIFVDKVVCIDTTTNGEKERLPNLILKINSEKTKN